MQVYRFFLTRVRRSAMKEYDLQMIPTSYQSQKYILNKLCNMEQFMHPLNLLLLLKKIGPNCSQKRELRSTEEQPLLDFDRCSMQTAE
jgi:hypothetical protein